MSIKKSKYQRRMRKRESTKQSPQPQPQLSSPGTFFYLEEIKPITREDMERLRRETIPPHLRGFIRSIVE